MSQETSDEETATLVELIIIMLSEPEEKNESCRVIRYWDCDSDDPSYLLAFYTQSTPTTWVIYWHFTPSHPRRPELLAGILRPLIPDDPKKIEIVFEA